MTEAPPHSTPSPNPAGDPPGSPCKHQQDQGVGAPAGQTLPPAGAFDITDSGTAVPTRAMEDVLAERWRQIHKFGHTPEKDAARSITSMHKLVHQYAHGLEDHVTAHGARSTMRNYAIRTAAALLAFIDRLDAEEQGL